MSHTLITCSPFSLVIFESFVLERFVSLSSIRKFCCFFQHNEMLCEGLDLGNAEIPKGTSVSLCCLLFPLSFWISEFFTILFLAAWYRFRLVTRPLVRFIGRPAPGLYLVAHTWSRARRLRRPPWLGPWGTAPLVL